VHLNRTAQSLRNRFTHHFTMALQSSPLSQFLPFSHLSFFSSPSLLHSAASLVNPCSHECIRSEQTQRRATDSKALSKNALRNLIAIAAESLRNRCGIDALSLRNRCAMRYRCTITALSMRYRCVIDALSMRYRCGIDAESMRYRCGIDAESMRDVL
jgi:hypothetical protein